MFAVFLTTPVTGWLLWTHHQVCYRSLMGLFLVSGSYLGRFFSSFFSVPFFCFATQKADNFDLQMPVKDFVCISELASLIWFNMWKHVVNAYTEAGLIGLECVFIFYVAK